MNRYVVESRMFVKPGDSDFVKDSLTFLEIRFLGQKIDK